MADLERFSNYVQAVRRVFASSSEEPTVLQLRKHARTLLKKLDENNSGVVSKGELEIYIKGMAELVKFTLSAEESHLFPEMLAEQIDIDRSGSITVQELEQFLSFDSRQDIRELGVLVSIARESLIRSCEVEFKDKDVDFMKKIADFGRVPLHQGKDMIVSQSLRRILGRAGRLSPDEAASVLQNIDSNVDGVVSSRELKSWLFPKEAAEERKLLLSKFAALINESFDGDATVFVRRLQKKMGTRSEIVGLSDFSSYLKVSVTLTRIMMFLSFVEL